VILAIESSCDETAAALVDEAGRLRANVVASQAELHARYGGVVPEVASRRHLELCVPVVEHALEQAGATLDDVSAVAVTEGPGLIGALLVGLATAKALAFARRLPLIPATSRRSTSSPIRWSRRFCSCSPPAATRCSQRSTTAGLACT
jgi:N6-L-threonylcarbamoyladenine synthase